MYILKYYAGEVKRPVYDSLRHAYVHKQSVYIPVRRHFSLSLSRAVPRGRNKCVYLYGGTVGFPEGRGLVNSRREREREKLKSGGLYMHAEVTHVRRQFGV